MKYLSQSERRRARSLTCLHESCYPRFLAVAVVEEGQLPVLHLPHKIACLRSEVVAGEGDVKKACGRFWDVSVRPTWKFRTPSQQLVWSNIAFRSSIPNWKVNQTCESTAAPWSRVRDVTTHLHVDAVLKAALGLGLHQPVAVLRRVVRFYALLRVSSRFPFTTNRSFRDLSTIIGFACWGNDRHLQISRQDLLPSVGSAYLHLQLFYSFWVFSLAASFSENQIFNEWMYAPPLHV